jgi:xanthine dehydrogenase accessory factor
MKELKLWKFIQTNIEQQVPLIFMCVLESSGSSPGRQGFKMVVSQNEIYGSIGGGIMEHKFVEMAREKLLENKSNSLTKKQIHNKTSGKNQSGMICSGEQTIYLYPIQEKQLKRIKSIISTLSQNKNGLLQLNSDGLYFYDNLIPQADYVFEKKSESIWEYEEKIGYKNYIYIIGGGHCSLALSKVMSTMDFYIHVFDERKNLNTLNQNKYAHKIEIIKSFELVKSKIPEGKNNYIVIMTFSYRTDLLVLRDLIKQNNFYIGLLGSKAKVAKLLDELKNEGIAQKSIDMLHAPIGIQIKSQTPEEIAISIAAELIQQKNALLG